MYNRYVPGHDGIYRRQTVTEKATTKTNCQELSSDPCDEKKDLTQQRPPCRTVTDTFDLGDLLLLCIVILLLIDSEDEDKLPLLIMAAVFLFLQ